VAQPAPRAAQLRPKTGARNRKQKEKFSPTGWKPNPYELGDYLFRRSRLLAENVAKRGQDFKGRRRKRGSYPPSSSSSSSYSLPPPKDLGSEGASSSRALTVARTVLRSRLLCLRARCLSFLVRLASRRTTSSGKVTLHGALHAYPRPYIRMCMR
jgi:hypothetical protein